MSKKITRREQRRRRSGNSKRYHRQIFKRLMNSLREDGRVFKLSEVAAAYTAERMGQGGLFRKIIATNPVIVQG